MRALGIVLPVSILIAMAVAVCAQSRENAAPPQDRGDNLKPVLAVSRDGTPMSGVRVYYAVSGYFATAGRDGKTMPGHEDASIGFAPDGRISFSREPQTLVFGAAAAVALCAVAPGFPIPSQPSPALSVVRIEGAPTAWQPGSSGSHPGCLVDNAPGHIRRALPGSLLLRNGGELEAIEGGAARVVMPRTDVSLALQTGRREILIARGRGLYAAKGFEGLLSMRLVDMFDQDVTNLSGQRGTLYAVSVGAEVPHVAMLFSLDKHGAPVEASSIDFGKDYGRLPLTCVAVNPKSREVVLGVGPDLYIGNVVRNRDPFGRDTFRRSVDGIQRIASCGVMAVGIGADREVTAFRSIQWSPAGDRLVGFVSRVHGSGWQSAFLVRKRGGVWRSRQVKGTSFAWSPDGRFLASEELHDVRFLASERGTDVVVRDSNSMKEVRRFPHRKLVGWLY
ncbi:MAG TPA: hypothetical protein VMI31_07760 [Fimbriimonadaceae bacterium]|nr:hypothetical protein [Fimbriimonadaceae bacterium]